MAAAGGVAEDAAGDDEDAADRPARERLPLHPHESAVSLAVAPAGFHFADEVGDVVDRDGGELAFADSRVDVLLEVGAVEAMRARAQPWLLLGEPFLGELLERQLGGGDSFAGRDPVDEFGAEEAGFGEGGRGAPAGPVVGVVVHDLVAGAAVTGCAFEDAALDAAPLAVRPVSAGGGHLGGGTS